MSMKSMKLIMENWKRFELNTSNCRPVLISENNKTTKVDFHMLLERNDSGVLSDDHLTTILIEDFDREYQSILEEGAISKIGNFFSDQIGKAKALLERGKLQGLILLNKIKDSLMAFKADHPIVFKVGIVLLGSLAGFLLMEMLSGAQAHAAITNIEPDALKAVAGGTKEILSQAMREGNFETAQTLKTALDALIKAHQMKDEIQFAEFVNSLPADAESGLRSGIELAKSYMSEAAAAGEGTEAESTLKHLIRIGDFVLKSK